MQTLSTVRGVASQLRTMVFSRFGLTSSLTAGETASLRAARVASGSQCSTSASSYSRPSVRRGLHAVRSVARAEAELQEGLLVEFKRSAEKRGVAVLSRRDGKVKWIGVDPRGCSHSIKPDQVTFVVPGRAYSQVSAAKVLSQAEAHADFALMETAWEVMEGDEKRYTVTEMAEMLYGSSPPSPAETYAGHRLLTEDRTFFRQVTRQPAMFQPRPASEVERIVKAAAAAAEAKQRYEELLSDLKAAVALPWGQKPSARVWQVGRWKDEVAAIFDLATCETGGDPQRAEEATKLVFALTRGTLSTDAAQVLKLIGYMLPHDSPELLKAGLTATFSPPLEEAASSLAATPDADAAARVDLRHLRSIAIDSAATTEVDDAISVEPLADGTLRVWVHVADPTCRLTPDHPLAEEARRRTTSLYLPTGSVPMFPQSLAAGLFSLGGAEECPSLTFQMTLGQDGSLLEAELLAATVRTTRLTYDQVDDSVLLDAANLPEAVDLLILLQAAERRYDLRLKQGAVDINLPEVALRVKDPTDPNPTVTLDISTTGEEAPAQRIVSEMMILAGEAAARIGHENRIPVPYRGQTPVAEPTDEELEEIPEGICEAAFMRTRMTRSNSSSSEMLQHGGLGLAGYVQTTSPIRRYADLLAHWQLKSLIRKQPPPYGEGELGALLDTVATAAHECKLLTRGVEKRWLAVYLKQESEKEGGKLWPAMLLGWARKDLGMASVTLMESGLEVFMSINRPAYVGENLTVCLAAVDVVAGTYRMEEVYVPSAEAGEEEEEGGEGRGKEVAAGGLVDGEEVVASLAEQEEVLESCRRGVEGVELKKGGGIGNGQIQRLYVTRCGTFQAYDYP